MGLGAKVRKICKSLKEGTLEVFFFFLNKKIKSLKAFERGMDNHVIGPEGEA